MKDYKSIFIYINYINVSEDIMKNKIEQNNISTEALKAFAQQLRALYEKYNKSNKANSKIA